jgi:hypothetical protein
MLLFRMRPICVLFLTILLLLPLLPLPILLLLQVLFLPLLLGQPVMLQRGRLQG